MIIAKITDAKLFMYLTITLYRNSLAHSGNYSIYGNFRRYFWKSQTKFVMCEYDLNLWDTSNSNIHSVHLINESTAWYLRNKLKRRQQTLLTSSRVLKQRIYLKGPSTCSSLQHFINSNTRVRYSKLSLLCAPPVKTTTKITHHGCWFSLLWALWAFKCSPLVITNTTRMKGKKYWNVQLKGALSSLRCKIQTHGNS